MGLDPVAAAIVVAAIFDRLRIRYAIGGAVASTILGEPRATHDLDLVAEIDPANVGAVIDAFEEAGFYVPHTAARTAVAARRSFNIIHRDSAMKVDVFVAGRTALDDEELQRRQLVPVSGTSHVYLATAEDVLLQKLLWYREGGSVSDRQWRDVLGLIKVQGPRLDLEFVERWATRLDVEDLLRQALKEAGLPDTGA